MPGCDPVQPDYVVVLAANAHIIRYGRIRGVPDLLVEVLSPSNATYDQDTKLPKYALCGIPEVAMIDPGARTLSHYQLEAPGRYASPRVAHETETVSFRCLPTLAVPVAELFAGAPDTSLSVKEH